MIAQSLGQVIYSTGYLENGAQAHVGYLDDDTGSKCQAQGFEPYAL